MAALASLSSRHGGRPRTTGKKCPRRRRPCAKPTRPRPWYPDAGTRSGGGGRAAVRPLDDCFGQPFATTSAARPVYPKIATVPTGGDGSTGPIADQPQLLHATAHIDFVSIIGVAEQTHVLAAEFGDAKKGTRTGLDKEIFRRDGRETHVP